MAEKKAKKTTVKKAKVVKKVPEAELIDVELEQDTLTAEERLAIVTKLVDSVKKKKGKMFAAVGRRKRSVARVWLFPKKGELFVNGKPISDVYAKAEQRILWFKPFHLLGVSHPRSKYSASIKVTGGGTTGQLDAIVHGLARALVKMSEENRSILKKAGLLTRDPREVERKKPSLRKARKKPQFSKR